MDLFGIFWVPFGAFFVFFGAFSLHRAVQVLMQEIFQVNAALGSGGCTEVMCGIFSEIVDGWF